MDVFLLFSLERIFFNFFFFFVFKHFTNNWLSYYNNRINCSLYGDKKSLSTRLNSFHKDIRPNKTAIFHLRLTDLRKKSFATSFLATPPPVGRWCRMRWLHLCRRVTPPLTNVRGMTINWSTWLGSSSINWENVVDLFIAVTPRSTLTQIGCTC